MKKFLLELILLLLPGIIIIAAKIIYYRRHPLKHIPLPIGQERIVFYPGRWPYLLVICGFILTFGIFSIIFLVPRTKELADWIFFSCLSLITLIPTVGLTYQMLTARTVVTSEYIEYYTLWTRQRLTINQIDKVRDINFNLYITAGNQRLKIPLIFKNSRELVWMIEKKCGPNLMANRKMTNARTTDNNNLKTKFFTSQLIKIARRMLKR
jgi:hypothetical protein